MRSRSKLLRALGNAEDGVSSAFPKGKQNGVVFRLILIQWFKQGKQSACHLTTSMILVFIPIFRFVYAHLG